MFFAGNDPVWFLRKLFELSVHCIVKCLFDALSTFSKFEPDIYFLKWRIIVDSLLKKHLVEKILNG